MSLNRRDDRIVALDRRFDGLSAIGAGAAFILVLRGRRAVPQHRADAQRIAASMAWRLIKSLKASDAVTRRVEVHRPGRRRHGNRRRFRAAAAARRLELVIAGAVGAVLINVRLFVGAVLIYEGAL